VTIAFTPGESLLFDIANTIDRIASDPLEWDGRGYGARDHSRRRNMSHPTRRMKFNLGRSSLQLLRLTSRGDRAIYPTNPRPPIRRRSSPPASPARLGLNRRAAWKHRRAMRPLRDILVRNMRRLRATRGLSQEALAHECGMGRTYLSGVGRSDATGRSTTLGASRRGCAWSRGSCSGTTDPSRPVPLVSVARSAAARSSARRQHRRHSSKGVRRAHVWLTRHGIK
jgi:hypothetical protein